MQDAIKAREDEWLRNNQAAIVAHNERIEKYGLLLTPAWARI